MEEQTLPRTMRRTFRPFLCFLPSLAVALGAAGCENKLPTDAAPPPSGGASSSPVQPGTPALPSELARPAAPPAGSAAAPAGAPLSTFPKPPAHAGPWFVVTSPAAGIYAEPS